MGKNQRTQKQVQAHRDFLRYRHLKKKEEIKEVPQAEQGGIIIPDGAKWEDEQGEEYSTSTAPSIFKKFDEVDEVLKDESENYMEKDSDDISRNLYEKDEVKTEPNLPLDVESVNKP